jgi:hypothetical protein
MGETPPPHTPWLEEERNYGILHTHFLILPSSAQDPAQLSWAELALILFPPARPPTRPD